MSGDISESRRRRGRHFIIPLNSFLLFIVESKEGEGLPGLYVES